MIWIEKAVKGKIERTLAAPLRSKSFFIYNRLHCRMRICVMIQDSAIGAESIEQR